MKKIKENNRGFRRLRGLKSKNKRWLKAKAKSSLTMKKRFRKRRNKKKMN
jgi:hypothetical protein